jgi:hypothetical protein
MGAGKHTDRLFAPGMESAYAATDAAVGLSRTRRAECIHDIIVLSHNKPLDHLRVDQSGFSSLWNRAIIYGLGWLPVFYVLFLAERFVPIFAKVQQKGDLTPLQEGLLTFLQLNTAWFRLPAILGILAIIAEGELAVFFLRQQPRGGRWANRCVKAIALMGVATLILVVYASTSVSSGCMCSCW